ncbi:unnamed protein product, partial [Coregonus sp. 'balchen']
MTKLQFLNVFLTERLMLAAQEIYKQVEETILEYQEEIIQGKRENDQLRRKLGIPWPVNLDLSAAQSENSVSMMGVEGDDRLPSGYKSLQIPLHMEQSLQNHHNTALCCK